MQDINLPQYTLIVLDSNTARTTAPNTPETKKISPTAIRIMLPLLNPSSGEAETNKTRRANLWIS